MKTVKNIAKLHFLTQDNILGRDHVFLAEQACMAGIRWVQLRMKEGTQKQKLETAQRIKYITDAFGATLIINDDVDIAERIGAQGVHLGKSDMPLHEARIRLGDKMIIGGTVNSLEEMQRIQDSEVDYIGLGPFRFTSTKKNLSAVLGLEKIAEIAKQSPQIPVIVIGGVQAEDVAEILKTGLHGVAVSSAINMAEDIGNASKLFLNQLSEYKNLPNFVNMKNFLFLAFVLLSILNAQAQNLQLKAFIGLNSLPADNESICPIQTYKGNFDASGLKNEEKVNDFTLYTVDGKAVNLKTELEKDKPVLLIAGSYTCPVFRNRIPEINSIYNSYKDKINIYIIYVVEAHPVTDISPYSGKEWVTSQNQQEKVLYRQPKTYNERKQILSEMTSKLNILPTILLDGPCNEWWKTFGPAPNNAYLIDKQGIIYEKQGWFNKAPANMGAAIDSLLKGTVNGGGTGNGDGNFIFSLIGDSITTALPGEVFYAYGYLKNISQQPVTVNIKRTSNLLPQGWESAMCTDICLASDADSTLLYLNPSDSQHFTMYFYSNEIPGNAGVTISFSNLTQPQNRYIQNFEGRTSLTANIVGEQNNKQKPSVYPNPFTTSTIIFTGQQKQTVLYLYNSQGKLLREMLLQGNQTEIKREGLSAGLYFLKIASINGNTETLKLLITD